MSETLNGKVKWFNDTKGYGFIEHESGRDVFVHYSVIASEGYKTLKDGEAVEYEIIEGDKGLHASKVMRLAGAEEEKKPLREQIVVESTGEAATPEMAPDSSSSGESLESEQVDQEL